jgi:hypothetical protein
VFGKGREHEVVGGYALKKCPRQRRLAGAFWVDGATLAGVAGIASQVRQGPHASKTLQVLLANPFAIGFRRRIIMPVSTVRLLRSLAAWTTW